MKNSVRNEALAMVGGAYERGKAQAKNAIRSEVLNAVNMRLNQNEAVFEAPKIREYMNRQWEFANTYCHDELSEMIGVADGFDIDSRRLFDFLHMGIAQNLGNKIIGQDGCSTWAVSNLGDGPVVGKNRDYMGEHAGLQAVCAHQDPDWPQNRRMLCVGSMGAPGAYSSGINSDGLVVVDTHVSTSDHGTGWLRYFLMTRLLSHCASVVSALEFIKSVTHAGGGSLILADPGGQVAAVDLGHSSVSIVECNNGWVARTNHFEAGSVANLNNDAPIQGNTVGRYQVLTSALSREEKSLDTLTTLMQSHTSAAVEGLCRHGEDDDSHTLSSAIFLCKNRKLYFADGNPCNAGWKVYSV